MSGPLSTLVTELEAADYLGVSLSTVRRLRRVGELPFKGTYHRPDGHIVPLLAGADVERLMTRRAA